MARTAASRRPLGPFALCQLTVFRCSNGWRVHRLGNRILRRGRGRRDPRSCDLVGTAQQVRLGVLRRSSATLVPWWGAAVMITHAAPDDAAPSNRSAGPAPGPFVHAGRVAAVGDGRSASTPSFVAHALFANRRIALTHVVATGLANCRFSRFLFVTRVIAIRLAYCRFSRFLERRVRLSGRLDRRWR